jgi:hypothetical protein
MQLPHGRPIIDVTTFPVLAKLAERYGLLILHWARSGGETFVVQDENTTYRYQTECNPQKLPRRELVKREFPAVPYPWGKFPWPILFREDLPFIGADRD